MDLLIDKEQTERAFGSEQYWKSTWLVPTKVDLTPMVPLPVVNAQLWIYERVCASWVNPFYCSQTHTQLFHQPPFVGTNEDLADSGSPNRGNDVPAEKKRGSGESEIVKILLAASYGLVVSHHTADWTQPTFLA